MNSAVRVILPTTSPFFGRRGPVWLLSQGLTPIRPAHRGLCRGEGRVASLAQVLAEYRDRVSLFAQSEQEWACLWRQMEALCERPGLDAQVRCFLEANLREHGQVYSAVLAGEKAMRERRPLLLASTRALTHPEMNLWGRHLSADFAADYLAVLALATLRHVRANPALQCHRRAGSEQDRVCPSHSECVVVCRAGQYYHLPLRGVPAEQLFEVLRQAFLYLVSAGHSPAESLPVGLLSTLPRHDTAHGYGLLHPETLARILDCQLLVSLEQMDQVDTGQCESGRAEVARHLLQSDPANIGHRWLDKGIQLVVIGNRDLSRLYGSGVCFEPSVVSTGSVARLVESTVRFVSSFQRPAPAESGLAVEMHRLRPCEASHGARLAKSLSDFALPKYVSLSEGLHLRVLHFTPFGASLVESRLHCEPRAFVQMAVHRALFRLFGRQLVPCLTVPPSALPELAVQSLTRPAVLYLTDDRSQHKLKAALASLAELAAQSELALSLDHILQAYLHMCRPDQSHPLAPLLRNPVYARYRNPLMHTYSLTSPLASCLLCPPIPGGMTCAYTLCPTQVVFSITGRDSAHQSSEQTVARFKEELSLSMQHLQQVMSQQ